MARMGKFSCSDLKKLQKQLESLETQRDTLMEACAKELAARLLAKVKKPEKKKGSSRDLLQKFL